jgi:hypothetical protein
MVLEKGVGVGGCPSNALGIVNQAPEGVTEGIVLGKVADEMPQEGKPVLRGERCIQEGEEVAKHGWRIGSRRDRSVPPQGCGDITEEPGLPYGGTAYHDRVTPGFPKHPCGALRGVHVAVSDYRNSKELLGSGNVVPAGRSFQSVLLEAGMYHHGVHATILKHGAEAAEALPV